MRTRITLAIVAALAAPVVAQSGPSTPPTGAAAPPDANAGYTYHPDGRRDPFVSLVRRAPEVQSSATARPAGLAGLGIADVTLKGTVQGPDGYLAMLLGADNKTYIVRPGDRLLDGVIRAITPDSLVVLQQVNDPPAPPKQREVRKMLRQTEGVK